MLGAYLGQLGEYLLLQRRDLGHRFDDEVDLGQVFHPRRGRQARACRFRDLFCDPRLRDIFGQQLVGELEAFVQRRW